MELLYHSIKHIYRKKISRNGNFERVKKMKYKNYYRILNEGIIKKDIMVVDSVKGGRCYRNAIKSNVSDINIDAITSIAMPSRPFRFLIRRPTPPIPPPHTPSLT